MANTLREHLEAILDCDAIYSMDYVYPPPALEEAMAHAQAALKILEDAPCGHYPYLPLAEGRYREVPDPEL